jgi:hypothetical protein
MSRVLLHRLLRAARILAGTAIILVGGTVLWATHGLPVAEVQASLGRSLLSVAVMALLGIVGGLVVGARWAASVPIAMAAFVVVLNPWPSYWDAVQWRVYGEELVPLMGPWLVAALAAELGGFLAEASLLRVARRQPAPEPI